jgi:hypothetical protein
MIPPAMEAPPPTGTPDIQSHKKVANNSISNRTKRKRMTQSKNKYLSCNGFQLHAIRR